MSEFLLSPLGAWTVCFLLPVAAVGTLVLAMRWAYNRGWWDCRERHAEEQGAERGAE
jgi:hypothetical protein